MLMGGEFFLLGLYFSIVDSKACSRLFDSPFVAEEGWLSPLVEDAEGTDEERFALDANASSVWSACAGSERGSEEVETFSSVLFGEQALLGL